MNVLLTAHRFWPHVGGTEIVIEQLAKRFARAGHDVTVATSREPDAPEEETRDGYRIRRFDLRRIGPYRVPSGDYAHVVTDPEWDVVHLHGQRVWSTDVLLPQLRHVRAPIVFTAHGFYQWHVERTPLLDHAYYRALLPRALRRAARVTVLTEAERGELAAWGVAQERLVRVPGGYDPAEFDRLPEGFRARHGLAEDEPLLLYVGGFYRNKRVDRLVRAAARADARLVVIGKDAHALHGRAACEALAVDAGARLTVLGEVAREDVLAAYRASDVFVLGSDFEGFGLVLLEAMASGLPFVSTPAGAAPELAAAGGGVLAEGAEGLAREVRALLDAPARRDALAREGREAVRAYTWDRVARQYLDVYEEVARR